LNVDEFSDEVLEQVGARLREIPAADLRRIGDPAQIAAIMISSLPEPHRLSDLIGPAYSTATLAGVLGVRRQALSQKALGLRLLRLRTSDRVCVFPAFQFTDDHKTIPGLHPVLEELRRGTRDPWTWAQWLAAEPDGRPSAVKRLRAGDVDEVIAEARLTAHSWAA
jgi:hypothetical protein